MSLSLLSPCAHRRALPLRLEVAGCSHPGRKRPHNEDAFAIRPDLGLLVVADGLGGHAAGEIASHMAVDSVSEVLTDAWSRGARSAGTLLVPAIQQANARVFAAARQSQATRGMGTTIVAALAHGKHVAIAHVGDSRAYLLRGRRMTRLTEDHTLENQCRLAGINPATRPDIKPHLHSLTRAVGTDERVEIDVRYFEPRADDVLLLCSDGLNCTLDDHEIASVLAVSGDPGVTAEQLVTYSNDNGGPDNITVVLAKWKT